MSTCKHYNQNYKLYQLGNSIETPKTTVWLLQWIVEPDKNKGKVCMKKKKKKHSN